MNKNIFALSCIATTIVLGAAYIFSPDNKSSPLSNSSDLENGTNPVLVKSKRTPLEPVLTDTPSESLPSSEEAISNANSIFDDLFPKDDRAWAWAKVDLQAIRNDIPDNLYWTLAAPTEDQSLIDFRLEQKASQEALAIKVSSNTASEKEIRAHFDHIAAISNDYIEFSTLLLNRHGHELPEQDYSMQILARNMHLGRLEEIPRQLTRALENRTKHEDNRQAWLEDKESYESQLANEREEALRALGKI